MGKPQPEYFKAIFSGKSYYVKIILTNSEGDVVVLKKSALRYLEIEDNIFNPFHSGQLILTNDFNILENSVTPYVFLGNGRDMLFVEIQPENSPDSFLLSLLCVVAECTELVYQQSLCKKIVFVEYGQYAINEKFCNVLSLNQGSTYLQTNAAASQTTGDLIKKIINDTFDNTSNDLSLFDVDASNKPMFDQEGCGSIRVSPYSLMSYRDLLSYAMQMHTHRDSPCILQHDRISKKFQLVSLQRLFEENSKHVRELFRFSDPKQVDNTAAAIDSASNPTIANIKFDYYPINFDTDSQIAEFYVESPAAKYGVDHFANQAISSYSKSSSTFIYNLQSLAKDEYTKTYANLFCKPFEKLFSKYTIKPNFYTFTNDQQKKWIDSSGAIPPEMTEKQFINQKLVSLLYLNYTYIFKLPGNTSRQAMTFIDVYKRSLASGEAPSRWDYNTLGRHFVTCVRHVFTQDAYHNQIETIKPYRLVDAAASKPKITDFLKG